MSFRTGRLYGWWREVAGALLVLASRLVTMPKTLWENDEFLFSAAVRDFDPSLYHPHPPGYPLYVLLGKAFNAITHDPFAALVSLSIVSSVVGFVALSRLFRRLLDDADLAVCGALLFYFSAAMLVHSSLPMSDPSSVMFLALALLAMTRIGDTDHVSQDDDQARHQQVAILVGLACSAAIGCRPQLAVPLLPTFAVALWQMRSMRERVVSVASFALLSLMWFLPLMDAAGGPEKLLAYEQKQATYFAAHDASMSRGAMSAAQVATRFVLHPWGSKYLTLPLLFCIAIGLAPLWRKASTRLREMALLPLIAFTVIQLAFALASMDPADAARYALPSMILFALVAAAGFGTIRRSVGIHATPWLLAALFAIGSWIYVEPILAQRTKTPSPVAAAAAYANATYPRDTVIVYELSLRPHAEYLMHFRTMAIEAGLRAFYDHPEVPIVLLADGSSHVDEAKVFAWPESDAYGKLTRNLYRQITLDPIRPEERYLPESGVYALERTTAGDEWRWLAREATLRLPRNHGSSLSLALRLSTDTPYETNDVRIFVNGVESTHAQAHKGTATSVAVPLPNEPDVELRLVSAQSFAPATVLHNQDPRTLAVQLTGLETKR